MSEPFRIFMLFRQKILKENLKRILADFDLGKILKTEPMLTSGNIAYLIEAEKGKFVLRLCPEGDRWRSREEIMAELELINYLNKHKFPAPCPINKKNKEIIIEHKNSFGYLRKFDSGQAVLEPSIKQVGEFGKILGWFHNLIGGYQARQKREHLWDLKTTQEHFLEVKEIILKSRFSKANDFATELERKLFALSFPDELSQGMIHEDLGKRHILWKDNKISCILDFDRCYYGKLVLDLGQACRGWCFINSWEKWSNENFQALISGYQSKRKLTELEKKYLIDAIKFGILERALAFCLRFIETTQDPEDEIFAKQSVFSLVNLVENNRKEIDRILKMR